MSLALEVKGCDNFYDFSIDRFGINSAPQKPLYDFWGAEFISPVRTITYTATSGTSRQGWVSCHT